MKRGGIMFNRLNQQARKQTGFSKWSFSKATVSVLFVGMFSIPACRTSTVGVGFALVGDGVTEIDARHRQKSLVMQPLAEAYADLGEVLDVFSEIRTGDRYYCFATTSVPGTQSFYLVQVSSDDEVVDVQHWIDWHDGFEDSFKLAVLEPKIVGKNILEAEAGAKLDPPIFVFNRQRRADQLRVYNATNWTHVRPRLLAIAVDEQGVCREASYYGVAGAQSLQQRLKSHEVKTASLEPNP